MARWTPERGWTSLCLRTGLVVLGGGILVAGLTTSISLERADGPSTQNIRTVQEDVDDRAELTRLVEQQEAADAAAAAREEADQERAEAREAAAEAAEEAREDAEDAAEQAREDAAETTDNERPEPSESGVNGGPSGPVDQDDEPAETGGDPEDGDEEGD